MKIRGNTISTPIKPEKIIVKATGLSEEQKAQARANIGASAIGESGGITVTDDGNGNVTIFDSTGISITDDGNGNVTIG